MIVALLVTAEDDDLRAVMLRSLQRAGHRVIATADGAQGLAAVRQHRPDAVITDVDMPFMTALDLTQPPLPAPLPATRHGGDAK